MTDFCDNELLGFVVIVEKLNLGKIAKYKKFKNTIFFCKIEKNNFFGFLRLLLIQNIPCYQNQS